MSKQQTEDRRNNSPFSLRLHSTAHFGPHVSSRGMQHAIASLVYIGHANRLINIVNDSNLSWKFLCICLCID